MIGVLLAVVSTLLSIPIFITYIETGLVPRFPTAILSAALMILAFIVAFTGLILDTVVRGRREALRMHYLSVPFPSFSDYASFIEPAPTAQVEL
jgi:hypothetical protein